jgi:hypothetical protein
MTYDDIWLVLAHKRKEIHDDNMEIEEFQAKVHQDLIAHGYVKVDQEYWAKMEPCFDRSDPGIHNSLNKSMMMSRESILFASN